MSEIKNGEVAKDVKKDGKSCNDGGDDQSSVDAEDDGFNLCHCFCLEKVSDVVTSSIQGFFHRIGKFSGRFPWISILIGLTIFVLPLFGLTKFYEETNGAKLWVPNNSRAVADAKRSDEWFPAVLRVVRVIVVADDVLTPEVLAKSLELDRKIKNISVDNEKTGSVMKYEDMCFKTGPFCLQKSLLLLWNFNESIVNLTKDEIVDKINDPQYKRQGLDQYLGDARDSNSDGEIDSASAMSMTYFLQTYTKDSVAPEPYILDWEAEFVRVCGEGIQGLSVYYLAIRGFADIGGGAIEDDLKFLGVGYILVILYLTFNLGKLNCREHKIYIALAGILCILMSIGISYGCSSAIGLAYGPLNNFLPFLLLGIGVDNMFVFVAAYETLEHGEKGLGVGAKIGLMVKHAGVSILITSLTDVSAFAIGATTIIPALRSFCLFAAFGIMGVFCVTLFFFTGVLTYDQKRLEAKRNACCCCFNLGGSYTPNQCSQHPLSYRFFDQVVGKGLSFVPVKVAVGVATVVLFGVGLAGAVMIEQDFQEEWFIPEGNYFYDFIQVSNQYFQDDGEEAYVFFGDIEYFENDQKLLELPKRLGELPQISYNKIDFWLTSYYEFLNQTLDSQYTDRLDSNKRPIDGEAFVDLFLLYASSEGKKHQGDVNFDTNKTRITSSRMMLWFWKTSKSSEGIDAMDDSREVVDSLGFGEDKAFVYSEVLLTWEGYKVIRWELFRNVGLAFLVVFLVCLVLIANIATVLLVLACVVFTMVEVVGFLHFWGLTINVVTTVAIVLSIGLAVDYAAHIAHSFMNFTGSRQQRMRKSMRAMGSAVFSGGFSTFLAFLPLIMSTSFVLSTFFKVFLLVAFCGLFQGLLFLPVALSLVGPSPYLSLTREIKEYDAPLQVPLQSNHAKEKNTTDV